MIQEGVNAVDFALTDAIGNIVHLGDFKGKKIVLYFYPKDDTPGCTVEACSFRDVYDVILAAGAVVIGISPDGQDSHEKFRNKFNLPFHLLSDPEHKIAEAYGATHRSTFIIDEKGIVAKVFPKVTPEGHAEEVLDALKG
jgi:thioredoxin-dependent peroxiredoxin